MLYGKSQMKKQVQSVQGVMAIKVVLSICLITLAVRSAFGAVIGETKKPYEDLPDDKPRKHAELIHTGPHEYRIRFRGTVDGAMTRMPRGHTAFLQGWQPNRSAPTAVA